MMSRKTLPPSQIFGRRLGGRPGLRASTAWGAATVFAFGVVMGACEPTVKLAAPDKPIVINLNVKIEREVRVKVEREIEDVIRENEEIF